MQFLLILSLVTLLQGCVKNLAEQGYATNFTELADSGEAVTTKEEVRAKLGSPSTISTFGDETWYYIRSKTENVAFLMPEPITQEVLAVTFNKEGNISKAEYYQLKDGRRIEFAEDETPTEGNKLGVAEQLLGNLGRFNPNQ